MTSHRGLRGLLTGADVAAARPPSALRVDHLTLGAGDGAAGFSFDLPAQAAAVVLQDARGNVGCEADVALQADGRRVEVKPGLRVQVDGGRCEAPRRPWDQAQVLWREVATPLR